ncbi:Smr domain containing protein [Tylopilus felleus]
MEKLNAEASAAIFKENNQDRDACEVDLHGLYVKEAIAYSDKTITDARRRADPEVRLIVGQGNHSEGGVSRLKPAIQEDLQSRGYRVDVDPKNAGVLIVRLGERR